MLVDDNEIDNLINRKMIEKSNFAKSIMSFVSAKEALSYLDEVSRTHNKDMKIPEVIFLDINMPYIDGFTFLEEFDKYTVAVKDHCLIYMVSSSINPEDIERARTNKYIVDYVSKPVTINTLHAL